MKIVQWLRVAVLTFLLLAGATAQKPQAPSPSSPQAPPQSPAAGEAKVKETPHEMTASDMEAFLDGFLPMQLERENIAGAVVAVVKDGKVVFAKGYGYADVEKKKSVTPDDTLFRPGSISKLFTWTAIMQLVQQGKLDLDHDVNDYLDFKIPATYPQPITLRNVLTHTTGFEETFKELFVPEGTALHSLKDYLTHHMPKRIFPPGAVPAYSNYAATLAGYIVERTAGQPFNDYVAEHIFRPLGMQHSTFLQPLPAELKPLMSNGYNLASDHPKPFEVVEPAPAGALASTAADLSRFMIAHLQDGRYENAEILSPQIAQEMHARQKGFNPELNAMALGFYEESRNGHRIIGHGGDTFYFHSDLHLVLDAGVGFFVSYNSAGKGEISARTALWNHFLDRYFPYTPPNQARPATAVEDAKTVAGYYMSSRRAETTFASAQNSFDEAHVVPDKDGDIKVLPLKDFSGQIKRWQEISPMVYHSVDGQDRIAFQKGAHGRWELRINFPAIIFQRAELLDSLPWNRTIVYYAMTILCLTLLLWPVAWVVRRHYGFKLDLTSRQKKLRLAIKLVCAIDIAFVMGLLAVLGGADDLTLLSGKLDPVILVLQAVGLIGAVGTLVVLYATLRLWRAPNLWKGVRWLNLLITLACLCFAWFVLHWHLVNFNMHY